MSKTNVRGIWLSLPLIVLAAAAGVYLYLHPQRHSVNPDKSEGISLILTPDSYDPNWPPDVNDQKKLLDLCRTVMLKRLTSLSFRTNPRIDVRDDGKIEVYLPGVNKHTEARQRITSNAKLEMYLLKNVQSEMNPNGKWRMLAPIHMGKPFIFISPVGEQIDALHSPEKFLMKVVGAPKSRPDFTSDDLLSNAKVKHNENNFAVVDIGFKKESGLRFAEFTRDNIGNVLAILYGNKLLMAPQIINEIPDGRSELSGFANIYEATQMADMINSGALPVGFFIESEKKIIPGHLKQ